MIHQVKQALSHKAIEKVFDLYRNSVNSVYIDDHWCDRFAPLLVGKAMLAKYTPEEFNFVWQEVQPHIDSVVGQTKLIYSRIIKYNPGCYIENHVDGVIYTNKQQHDLSVIIAITDPKTYRGGEMIVGGDLIELVPGDMIFYTYDVPHEIKPVKSGIRYVINLRCQTA
jgi:hypothetical protein